MKKAEMYVIESTGHFSEVRPKFQFRVATLNIAHGRGRSVHQGLLSQKRITTNLNKIAAVISGEPYDVIALQEVDEPSLWSRSINQISFLADSLGNCTGVHGVHVRQFKLHYGTALLSRLAVKNTHSYTFTRCNPLPPKGYTAAELLAPEINVPIHAISLHFDPLRPQVRIHQAEELIRHYTDRNEPLIVMGDFNDTWETQDSVVRFMARELKLKAFRPLSANMATFRFFKKRIDWIMVSSEFTFDSYEVIPEIISDHFMVCCSISLNPDLLAPGGIADDS